MQLEALLEVMASPPRDCEALSPGQSLIVSNLQQVLVSKGEVELRMLVVHKIPSSVSGNFLFKFPIVSSTATTARMP